MQLTDINKESLVDIICRDETKLDSSFLNEQFYLTDYCFGGTKSHQEEEK